MPAPLPAHPPSPRQQRMAAAAQVTDQRTERTSSPPSRSAPSRRSYLTGHWHGEIPLAAAVIVSGALVWAGVQTLAWLGRRFPITDYPHFAAALWLLEMALLMAGALWWGRGVQRAAMRHVELGGSTMVALSAGLTGLAAFFWVGAFWWLSARHIAPDVWSTLTGGTPPAQVHLDATRGELLVQGDLDFGSTRALRLALDAHPQVRRVHLESRGGRVKEGLAMGQLLRERNVDTLVSGECSSACVTAFAGGTRRLITAQAKLGLHSAGGVGVTAQNIAEANRETDAFIASRGVDQGVLAKGAAVANDQIWFPEPYVLLASNLATHYAHEVLPPR